MSTACLPAASEPLGSNTDTGQSWNTCAALRQWDNLKTSVLRAFPLQVAPDENASKAVDARQEIDLRIGAAFTRYQTLLLQVKLQTPMVHVNCI
jgi:hypothetical protein